MTLTPPVTFKAKSLLDIVLLHTSESGKTWVYSVSCGPHYLGEISWYGPWRKYTFRPAPQCVWDSKCLAELASSLELLTSAHKNKP